MSDLRCATHPHREVLDADGQCPDCLRSSLSAAEKELADRDATIDALQNGIARLNGESIQKDVAVERLRHALLNDVQAVYETHRLVREERDALRSELASLKAPADRFDAQEHVAAIECELNASGGICFACATAALRTAYQRGAQDQGAEIERLRGALRDMGDTARAHCNAKASGEDVPRVSVWWFWQRATEAISPAPSASPVDSLTGEAQRLGMYPQPVEAEQPKPCACLRCSAGDGRCLDCGASRTEYLAREQRAKEQPKPAAECEACGGSGCSCGVCGGADPACMPCGACQGGMP